jgi:hypothetical protein
MAQDKVILGLNFFHLLQTRDGCISHIVAMKHGTIIHPVKVAGIVCPQCLSIFASYSECHHHMLENKHFHVSHPFPGMSAHS